MGLPPLQRPRRAHLLPGSQGHQRSTADHLDNRGHGYRRADVLLHLHPLQAEQEVLLGAWMLPGLNLVKMLWQGHQDKEAIWVDRLRRHACIVD